MVNGLQGQGDKTGPIAVLGACGGIGRTLTASLHGAGVAVVALDLPESLAKHRPQGPAIAIDVLSEASIAEAMQELARFGKLSGFVNLAGYSRGVMTLEDTADDVFDETLAGNLRGAFLACRAVLPLMASPGAMVLVSSGLAHYIRPGHGAYAVAKAGLIALAKTFAVECAPDIRVNVVAPGPVDTAFITGGTGRSDERQRPMIPVEEMAAAIPMRRIACAQDVVGPITFLLGPASAYMTGQVLWVNGGAYMP